MPVADHPIHDSVVVKEGYKYGCFDKVSSPSYQAKNGYTEGVQQFVQVPHVMSTECRYDMAASDKFCTGCNQLI